VCASQIRQNASEWSAAYFLLAIFGPQKTLAFISGCRDAAAGPRMLFVGVEIRGIKWTDFSSGSVWTRDVFVRRQICANRIYKRYCTRTVAAFFIFVFRVSTKYLINEFFKFL
jgi:hypothetical protein